MALKSVDPSILSFTMAATPFEKDILVLDGGPSIEFEGGKIVNLVKWTPFASWQTRNAKSVTG
jgi:hypothetical protein